jgi:hypothetical protein
MKKTYTFYSLLAAVTILIFSSCESGTDEKSEDSADENKTGELTANAGDCNGYYPLNEGVKFELTSYDLNNQATGVVNSKITKSEPIENGIKATYEMVTSDQDGNKGMEMSFDARCQDGKYYLNLETMFSQLTSQYKAQGMEISFENGISVVPNDIVVGDKLEDVAMLMKLNSEAMNMDMTITISDREVIGKETKTTPAGTFECMILSQKTTTQMGDIMTVTSSSKEWLSKGVGAVRSENYDKNGDLEGYTLLTDFSK